MALGFDALSELPLSTQKAIAGGGGISGTLATTEAADVLAASGVLGVTGAMASIEALDTFAASGTVGTGVTGTLAATEALDTFAATGTLDETGSLAATEAADVFSASGVTGVPITGTLAATEAPDVFTATGDNGNADTHDGPGYDYWVKLWKQARDKEQSKRRKRRKKDEPAIEPAAILEEVAPVLIKDERAATRAKALIAESLKAREEPQLQAYIAQVEALLVEAQRLADDMERQDEEDILALLELID